MAHPVDLAQEAEDKASDHPEPETQHTAAPPQPPPGSSAPDWRRSVAAASSKLAFMADRAGEAVAGASAMTLALVTLGSLLALSVIASLASQDALGIASAVLFVPVLSAGVGALGMRCFDIRRADRALHGESRRDMSSMDNLERSLGYVDAKLTTALGQFGTERHNDAVIAMFQAKAVTELYLPPEDEAGAAVELLPSQVTAPPHYPLADYLAPNALLRTEQSDQPAGLSLI